MPTFLLVGLLLHVVSSVIKSGHLLREGANDQVTCIVLLVTCTLVPLAGRAKLHRHAATVRHALRRETCCRTVPFRHSVTHMPTLATTKMRSLLPSRWPPPIPTATLSVKYIDFFIFMRERRNEKMMLDDCKTCGKCGNQQLLLL